MKKTYMMLVISLCTLYGAQSSSAPCTGAASPVVSSTAMLPITLLPQYEYPECTREDLVAFIVSRNPNPSLVPEIVEAVYKILTNYYKGFRGDYMQDVSFGKWGSTFRCSLGYIRWVLEQVQGKDCLEIAAASGPLSCLMILAGAKSVTINDIDDQQQWLCKANIACLPEIFKSRVKLKYGDCFGILTNCDSGEYDFILCRNLIHFFNKPQRDLFYRLIDRILRPSGSCMLTVNGLCQPSIRKTALLTGCIRFQQQIITMWYGEQWNFPLGDYKMVVDMNQDSMPFENQISHLGTISLRCKGGILSIDKDPNKCFQAILDTQHAAIYKELQDRIPDLDFSSQDFIIENLLIISEVFTQYAYAPELFMDQAQSYLRDYINGRFFLTNVPNGQSIQYGPSLEAATQVGILLQKPTAEYFLA